MFERFTERARQVVVLAQEEALALRHAYIGTEHLLLGLLREDGNAARALASLGVELEAARTQVARAVARGDEAPSGGQVPFTPRAKKVLELALREALALGHNWIGTEHILLGLVREGDGVASRILLDFGADAERVRDAVIGLLAAETPRRGAPVDPSSPRVRRRSAPPVAPAARFPLAAVAVGWFGFGAAVGIGLLLGWLIWG
ncbi:MAG TPA: Clp protease N-terminal domain-containing protein [Gaiellaceae bacterium]|nr:Clp protease N-terminal domain-containing protein [Gaiellaceae bacterium]